MITIPIARLVDGRSVLFFQRAKERASRRKRAFTGNYLICTRAARFVRVYICPWCLAIGRTRVSAIARSILEPGSVYRGAPFAPSLLYPSYNGLSRQRTRTKRAMWRRNTSMPLHDGICNGDNVVEECKRSWPAANVCDVLLIRP